jgi:hypothetical protein
VSNLSRVEIRLTGQPPACVLDAGLALSPNGLLLAMRLAREWPVWLVRSMWPMIDSDQLYRERPHLVAASGEPASRVAALIDALGDWQAAWVRQSVKGIHWPGDHRHESDFPDDADEGLLARFDALAASLIAGGDDRETHEAWSWRRTCACEALALAAALQTRPTIVLASLEDGARPLAVSIWDEFKHVESPPLALDGAAPVALPASLRIGMPLLLGGGLGLAAIHVMAPRALTLPREATGDGLWTEGAANLPGVEPVDPWQGAMLSWHAIT